ncbi:MAG TPA: DNA gyrase subunit A [Candidatus Paceibacterota bacterium]|nr:DNA gyrase subunit A [Candidatus Paceibacterota bacterium]
MDKDNGLVPESLDKNIIKKNISEEISSSYLSYAMSVIVARALPDVRDGLKPVQRRILYAMNEIGLTHGGKTRKSAAVVGEVLAKYHPHGDTAVYDTMARMAQDFSLRYPMVHGQGNFGSIDGDSPAAMRYTEAKLSALAEEMLADIDKDTVDFIPNYDNTKKEPTVLPARIPFLLLNGALGIAVGMATSIPPHNLGEVVDALLYLIDNPDCVTEDLLNYIKGPDFPTGGIIYDKKALVEAYSTGQGKVITRAKAEIVETKNSEEHIVVTEIPFLVNKAELIKKIASLVEEKTIEDIKDLRDESDKDGLRIVIELKKGAASQKILAKLYRYTELEKAFYFNVVALTDNGLQPKILPLKNVLEEFLNHREIVVRRKTAFLLDKAKARAHILEGLKKALDHIDEIIKIIRGSESKEDAVKNLIKKFDFSELQANAILEIKLQNLPKLERQKIEDELAEQRKLIAEYTAVLKDNKKLWKIIKDDLIEIKTKYNDPRRTQIVSRPADSMEEEDLVPTGETFIALSKSGYIKRLPATTFKIQKRGGKGVIGYEVKNEDDFLEKIISADLSDYLLFFTDRGRVFQVRAYEIGEASRTSRGKLIQNFLELGSDENVTAILNYKQADKSKYPYLIMVTKKGMVKKTSFKEYENMRRTGLLAIKLTKDDVLQWVGFSDGNSELVLGTHNGQAIRFGEKDARPLGRVSQGVTAIKLKKDDYVIGTLLLTGNAIKDNKAKIVVITEHGYGKVSDIKDYRKQKRSGSGIKTLKITPKNGNLIALMLWTEEEELLAMSKNGQTIRVSLASLPVLNRLTQGVRVMKLDDNDKISSISLV